MKIYYENEILKCFEYQYPNKAQSYDNLLRGLLISDEGFELELVKIYDDMIYHFDFLITLIRKLQEKKEWEDN